jgi:MFS family permease
MNDPTMRTLTFSSTAMNAVGIFGFVAMIPFLKHEFGAGDQTVGLAFGCFSLGSVAGSLIAGRTHWPFGRALVIVYILDALFWLPIAWTHSLPLAVGTVTLCAACGAYEVTAIVSWRMRVIPADMIGRVFGVIRLLVLVGMVPGSILGGVIADQWGTRVVMGLSGGAFLLLALNVMGSRAVLSERR